MGEVCSNQGYKLPVEKKLKNSIMNISNLSRGDNLHKLGNTLDDRRGFLLVNRMKLTGYRPRLSWSVDWCEDHPEVEHKFQLMVVELWRVFIYTESRKKVPV